MEDFKISVIIPTYNRASQVEQAIDSARAQSYPIHEIIVIDDGSTDNTRNIIANLAKQTPTIRLIYQEQQGVSVARNSGIAAATGNWIAFLDSDDRWLPDKLSSQVSAIEQFGLRCGLCFTDAVHVDNPEWDVTVFQMTHRGFNTEIGIILNAPEYVAAGNHGIYIPTVLVRRDIVDIAGNFDPQLRIYEDNDFVFRVSRHTDFAFINEPLLQVNRSPKRSEGLMELFAKEDFRLQQIEYQHQKWLNDEMGMSPELRKVIEFRLRDIYAGWASVHLMNDHFSDALKSMQRSLSYGLNSKGVFKWALIKFIPNTTKEITVRRYKRSVKNMLRGLNT